MPSSRSEKSMVNAQPNSQSLFNLLSEVKLSDKPRLKKRLLNVKKIHQEDKKNKALQQIANAITQSIENKVAKLNSVPAITYPESLPVSQNLDRISQAIQDNQVVIIAGETGSGKTTQIPKICLELGRGIEGLIGHTQPRRIAARTVATRIAEELNTKLGDFVGYKVRFNDQVSHQSYIKLMTDGILLAEMQTDRLLRQYDTIIIDEAHERSLNIDFILGYIKQILPKRPDLKVIITSATIDTDRFSQHFGNAPVIEVSGRTFPVEVLYRPLLNESNNSQANEEEQNNQRDDLDVISGILHAVDELSEISYGDILIFLNGEREIRDTAAALEKANLRHTHILPLYARLTVQEQNKIFQPHSGRNIVLATNVAETSLTVPGIKYVIDPGTARISRYSYRTKVQRLPIEAISQASANQRSGRCGRVSAGVCIRLYSEDDFNNRPAFTDPEILRTNLATVILQMLSLDLGDVSQFPFVQPPDSRNINDGIKLLEELAAIEQPRKGSQNSANKKLTKAGRLLAKFPIDPRLSKMVLSAIDLGCIEQVLIIVSGLSIQDPRERPHEKQQAADEKHNRFKDKQSDFVSLLRLWHYINEQQKTLTNNQFRRLCKKEFLSYIRLKEWQDVVLQLKQTLKEQNIPLTSITLNFDPLDESNAQSKQTKQHDQQADVVHQALLSGLLSHLGQQDENREFKGARGSKFYIFPGSALAKKPPKWLMAAELVETSRLFGRMVAKIDPLWLEPLAQHLVKRSYSEPHWEKKQGAVVAFEQVSLYGLIIVGKRKVNFNQIEPHTCRDIFIREALVNSDCVINEKFFKHNNSLVADIETLEKKARRKDFLIEEQHLVDFYDEKIPENVTCLSSFLAWWKVTKQSQGKLLNFTEDFLLNDTSQALCEKEYPNTWQQGSLTLPLEYHFAPGDIDDGISVIIPVGILNQVQNQGFDWLIPALRFDLLVALIKSLPKTLRRNFVPAPNYASACLDTMVEFDGSIHQAFEKQLLRMTGVRLPDDVWQASELPVHLTMNFKILNEKNKLVKQGRDLEQLKAELQGKVKASIQKVAEKGIEKTDLSDWDFGELPTGYEKKVANITVKAFPALVDKKQSVAIELFEHAEQAEQAMINGVCRLILLNIPSPIKYLQEKLPNKAKLGLYFNPFGTIADLLQDCIQAGCQYLIEQQGKVARNNNEFKATKDYVRAELAECVLTAAIKVEKALSLSHDIRKKLKGKVALNVIQSNGDIKEQLNGLIFKGFVSQSGIDKLDDIIRYLHAILRRLEKLSIDTNQDRLKLIEVAKVEEQLNNLVAKQRQDIPLPNNIADTRWMLEELRVSLFAQNLGTAYPISVKRIVNHLKTL
mgnify:CR=1 FL=1